MNLYSIRRGEWDGQVLPDNTTLYHKYRLRTAAVRVVPMPNGRFGLVKAAFRGQHWVERPVGNPEGYCTEAEAERSGRLLSH